MRGEVRLQDQLLALILAMGKDEFEGEIEDALDALFRRHLDLLNRPKYLQVNPRKLTFEDELRGIFFHLGCFSWTYQWGNRGSYYTRYRIENRAVLERIVEEARIRNPERIAQFEKLSAELKRELQITVEYRRNLVIPVPGDHP